MDSKAVEEIYNKYEKDFNEAVTKKEGRQYGGTVIFLGILFIILALVLICNFELILVGIILILIGLVTIYFCIKKVKENKSNNVINFHKKYCDEIMREVLELSFDEVQCHIDGSSVQAETAYKAAGYDKKYDGFASTANWSMRYGNHLFNLYNIDVYDLYRTSEGHQRRHILYGLYGIITLSHNFNSTIIINNERIPSGSNGVPEINMDSIEFEKIFKVYATDKQVAMQLLTHDVMDKIYNLILMGGAAGFDIRIIDDKLHVRVRGMNIENDGKYSLDLPTMKAGYSSVLFFVYVMNTIEKAIYDNGFE